MDRFLFFALRVQIFLVVSDILLFSHNISPAFKKTANKFGSYEYFVIFIQR